MTYTERPWTDPTRSGCFGFDLGKVVGKDECRKRHEQTKIQAAKKKAKNRKKRKMK